MYNSSIADALRDAQQEIDHLECHYELKTDDVLNARKGAEILNKIDNFDLIEWRFRSEQLKALTQRLSSSPFSHYAYGRIPASSLANNAESERELVA